MIRRKLPGFYCVVWTDVDGVEHTDAFSEAECQAAHMRYADVLLDPRATRGELAAPGLTLGQVPRLRFFGDKGETDVRQTRAQ